jgi:hypothetical protein
MMLSFFGSVAVALNVTGTPTTPELGPEMTGTVGALLVSLHDEPSITAAPIAAAAIVNVVLLIPVNLGTLTILIPPG